MKNSTITEAEAGEVAELDELLWQALENAPVAQNTPPHDNAGERTDCAARARSAKGHDASLARKRPGETAAAEVAACYGFSRSKCLTTGGFLTYR